ncbi:S1C family serine protease [Paenibacillus protaetiae]|uniref:PDZ domain-containing protein n=1 Tax=Paenibacillus protaetiae TaxID=2509456 RepID=A0A4P6ESP6_9BACL|nr:trypsin-like peptidase domain-containing protein [Paenibacillus protaetiae]QAY65013.1 PDZ domain-containing protein [Paenibacillus protaetiae]
MSDTNNNGYDDFFKANGSGEEQGERDNRNEDTRPEAEPSKPSYYYSYGPFKPGAGNSQDEQQPYASRSDSPNNGERPAERSDSQANPSSYGYDNQPYGYSQPNGASQAGQSYAASSEGAARAQQLRPFTPNPQARQWQLKEPRRRTSLRSLFASFLAGVVVVGVLMWASDNYNWFSNAGVLSTTSSSGTQTPQAAGTSGGASTVAARPDDLAQLFDEASPAVVKITTYVNAAKMNQGNSMLDDPFFRQFFGGAPDDSQQNKNQDKDQMQESGLGTGFFFDSSGYILTNQHVVADSDKIEVTVQGYDKPFTAELLGSSFDLDLAVLKVTNSKAFPTLKLGNSDDIKIGDWVVAIGNPYGFDHTITAGVLSAKERPISISDTDGTRNYEHLLQTDASINPGNSGGPLLNTEGEVIGINTAVSSQAQGIGFAIPTSTINSVLDDLKNNKQIPKDPVPFIGATLTDVTDQIAQQLGMDKVEGSIVTAVTYNSPAYKADLRQYDVILGIDGKKYNSTNDLIAEIQKHKVGDNIALNIVRNGKTMDLQVQVGDKNQFNVE